MSEFFDILIRKALIVDGTGSDKYIADIGIKGGKIVSIGELENFEASKIINAEGLILSPGFIDAHSHADFTLLLCPRAESSVMQGITTVVGGNCGFSPAPIKNKYLMGFWEFDIWDEIYPNFYGEQQMQPIEKVRPVFKEILGLDINWSTFGEFLKRVEDNGIAINLVPLVGHCQIRASVMEDDQARKASEIEMAEMSALLREAMEAGAFGFSTGLSYKPGVFSDKKEILELANVAKEYDGIYATHFNRTDLKALKGTKIKGIEEAIDIAKINGIRIQISHIYPGYDIYPEPSPEMIIATAKVTLGVIEKAAEEGVEIAFDVIPNIDGGVCLAPNLIMLVYSWFKQSGTVEQFLKNLKAEDYRESIKESIQSGKWDVMDQVHDKRWPTYITILQCKIEGYVGKTLDMIAEEKNIDPLDAVFDILMVDPDTKINMRLIGLYQESTEVFINHPKAMIGSDTFSMDGKGLYGVSKPQYMLPHPNTYGAFPKYLTEYQQVRIEDTIRKITGFPAEWFGIKNRGLIKEGYQADIVMFDPKKLKHNEDYIQPVSYPEGISYVIVNGHIVLNEGKHTGKLAGKVLRKNK